MNTKTFDFISFFLILILSLCGLLFIFSSTYTPHRPYSSFFIKQAIGISSAICIYFLCLIPDYRSILRWGYHCYFGVLLLLVFTLIKGSIGMGGQRWINLFFFKFQPSELAKLLLPAYIVAYLHEHQKKRFHSFGVFVPILATLMVSFLLIHKQPDLGTGLIVLFSGLIICWLAGINKKFFYYGGALFIIMAPLVWTCILHDYQKNRIIVFLGQGNNRKEAYQIEQASIAIGSGGLHGKGLCKGTQNKLRFLPESRTDFIFAVLCEEWGFIGASLILLCYFLLFARSFFLITKLKDMFTQLFACGLLLHILLATIINMSMVLSMLPIVGIPLPLMSYGLSNLWITYASFGIFQNIIMHCK